MNPPKTTLFQWPKPSPSGWQNFPANTLKETIDKNGNATYEGSLIYSIATATKLPLMQIGA